jgi:ABC-type antimicrobial peptide transport system permease subunit
VSFVVRTAVDPNLIGPQIGAVVARLAPKLPVVDMRTQSEEIDKLLFPERLLARLSSLFAALALALACIGLYALLSYEVTRRTREVGIRMTLGAQRGDVRRMVVKQGLGLTAIGILIGVGVATAATRPLETLLFGVAPTDPLVLGGVSVLLLVVAFLACYLPARRATRVDPMVALRSE